jgi:hypothetical protein
MNPPDLLYGAGGAWVAAALAGLLAASRRPGLLACCALSALGGTAAAAGGGWSLVYGNTALVTPGGGPTIIGGPLQLQATSLAGVFVALLGLVAVAIAWYAPRYHEPGRGTALYLAAYNPALLACLAVLTAGGNGHLPGRLGDHEPGVLPADPASPAQRRLGPRRVLVPGPVRDRLPAGRGGVRDPFLQDARHLT